MPLAIDDLTGAERAVWQAFTAGTTADLEESPDRSVRAAVIAALLRGAQPVAPGEAAAVTVVGAQVTGALELKCATVEVPLRLERCVFDEAPVLVGAQARTVEFVDCELPGFNGRLLRVDGDLSFAGSTLRGMLNLVRANVTGELQLSAAKLLNPGDFGLFAGGLTVEGAVFAHPSRKRPRALTVEGGFRLAGARLLGGLFLDGVHLNNPAGDALQGEGLQVARVMRCGNGFRAAGTVGLRGARIEGHLSFEHGMLADASRALVLANATIEVLDMLPAEPVIGLVDMQHARCGLLRDRPGNWSNVALNGFTYEAIESQEMEVAGRLRWIGGDDGGYRPQPYEQLASLYRRLGADADARQVLLAKQRAHRRDLRPPFRLVGHILDWTVGYGYKPWRAFAWFVLLMATGTWVFTSEPPVPAGAGRHFDAVMYTLDLLLPISAFGLRDAFAPTEGTRWIAYGLTAAGWILATALLAGISRALRRD